MQVWDFPPPLRKIVIEKCGFIVQNVTGHFMPELTTLYSLTTGQWSLKVSIQGLGA